jgi:hypothetical protein
MRMSLSRVGAAVALTAAATVLATASTASAGVTNESYYASYAGVSQCASTGVALTQYANSYWNTFACYASSRGSGYDLYLQHREPEPPVWKIVDSQPYGTYSTVSGCVNTALSQRSINSYWNTFACNASGSGYELILQHGAYVPA